MDFLGIGPLELFFIILIILIIFGPKDLLKASKTIGSSLRKLVKSDTWKMVTQTSRKLRNLPNEMMREAGMEEEETILPDVVLPPDGGEVPPAAAPKGGTLPAPGLGRSVPHPPAAAGNVAGEKTEETGQ